MEKISNTLDRYKAEKGESKPKAYIPKPQRTKVEDPKVVFANEYVKARQYSGKLVAHWAPDSVNAQMFKIIRGRILHNKNRPAPKAIMVTSALPGEGKTFVASNLAVTFAMGLDEKVFLIDTDLHHPSIHKIFGYTNKYGLSEHLQGKKDIPELLIKTKIENLTLLLSGNPPSNPVELLSSKNIVDFVKEAKDRYQDRFIIMDTAPSQLTAETNFLANHADGIILVVMCGKTPRPVIEKTVENFGREKILGMVFNGYNPAYKPYHRYTKYYKGS